MQTIQASKFKAKCLALMDQVARTGETIVVTKNGKPVAGPAAKSPRARCRFSRFGPRFASRFAMPPFLRPSSEER